MATINGVEVAGDKSAHDFGLLDNQDKTEIDNGIERNREATEDNREDIVRHRTDRDVHVTPEWKNSLVTKAILGLYWTAAQTADIINSISIASGAKLQPVEALPDVGVEQIIYMVPKKDPQQGDIFDEYVWINGKYEFIGTSKVNLSNYYNKTEIDYFFALLETQYVKANDTTLVRLVNENEINLQEDHYNAWFGYRDGKVTNWKFGDGTEGGLANVWANDYYLGDEKLSDLLGDKANDDGVVHIKGSDELIDSKTFISLYTQSSGPSLWMKNTSFTMGTAPATNRYSGIWVQDSEGRDTAYIVHQANKNNSQNLKLSVSNVDGDNVYQNALTFQGRLDGTFNFYSDNPANLGTSANKWSDVRTEKLNGETVVTPTYLENKAEEWEFTLSDGSTVTKKIVMA